jgi:hypothetical protein
MMTRVEVILEARRRKDAGEFNRKIVARYPDDMRYDRVDLACGHHLVVMHILLAGGERTLSCHECLAEWARSWSPARGKKTL